MNIPIIAKREYLKIVKKPTFWISTLFFPVFIAIVSFISGYSSQSTEKMIQEQLEDIQTILVFDESDYINHDIIQKPYEFVASKEEGVDKVKQNQADVLIYYPQDIGENLQVEIYAQTKGLLADTGYNDIARNIFKQSILLDLRDPVKITLVNQQLNTKTVTYENGVETPNILARLVIPGVSVVIYFMLITLGSNYLLLSVSEEKENRMIETILSIVKPKELIAGKIIGLTAVLITQLLLLSSLAIAVLIAMNTKLPIDISLSEIPLDPVQIILGIFFTLCGFLFMANIMVGVGSATPTHKEAQGLSSIFIILSIFPVYFAAIIIADPSGTIAKISSFFPFTAPMILLFRNAIGALSTVEMISGVITLIVYVILSFYIAYKAFEIGSLEYSQKISLKKLIKNLKKT